jgi:tRNA 2-thiouridine synthesizing protein A
LMQVFSKRDGPVLVAAQREVEIPRLGRVRVARSVACMGENCPRPQLLTMKALSQVEDGGVVELVSDNPAAVESIPALMLVIYCTHLATVREADCWRVFMRKGM